MFIDNFSLTEKITTFQTKNQKILQSVANKSRSPKFNFFKFKPHEMD